MYATLLKISFESSMKYLAFLSGFTREAKATTADFSYERFHCRRLVKNIGGANPNFLGGRMW